jgi:hypothetical protein
MGMSSRRLCLPYLDEKAKQLNANFEASEVIGIWFVIVLNLRKFM